MGISVILSWRQGWNAWVSAIISSAFIAMGILSLKLFFVKYIYGLPSHACLFDIFWGKYYYIGYMIFGSYYALGFAQIAKLVLQQVKPKLSAPTEGIERQLQWIGTAAAMMALLVPMLYWLAWQGEL